MRKFVFGIGCAFLFWLVLSVVFGLIYGVVCNIFGLTMSLIVCAIAAWSFIIIGFIFGLVKG